MGGKVLLPDRPNVCHAPSAPLVGSKLKNLKGTYMNLGGNQSRQYKIFKRQLNEGTCI